MSSGKWRSFCLGLNVLKRQINKMMTNVQHWKALIKAFILHLFVECTHVVYCCSKLQYVRYVPFPQRTGTLICYRRCITCTYCKVIHRRQLISGTCWYIYMVTSLNENIFRVTGHLCGEFPGHRWIPLTKAGSFMLSLICAWTNGWVNNRDAGDLTRHRAHHDVTVMNYDIAGYM